MADADSDQKGGMAVVLGLVDATVITICKEVSDTHYVEPVNFNTLGQVVIQDSKRGSLSLQKNYQQLVLKEYCH